MPEILDTQIISYALKGRYGLPLDGKTISAITANEFLMVQGSNLAQANYYVPVLSRFHFPESTDGISPTSRRLGMDHPFRKIVTDQVIIDFGNEYPTIVEYGNLAISLLINKQVSGIFHDAIKFLDKQQRKIIRKRFDFLLENKVRCQPLAKTSVRVAMELLQEFRKEHNLKENFRNSFNDMLILASAIDTSALLITEDSLLNKFASKQFTGAYQIQDGIATIDFSQDSLATRHKSRESKGYINKSWQVSFRNYSKS